MQTMVNFKIWNNSLFNVFKKKIGYQGWKLQKTLVRIANREDPDQTAPP